MTDQIPQRIETMLLAARLAGVPIPSETLRERGYEFPFDWRKLNAFQAAYPIRITHDEDGNRLPRLALCRHLPIEEADD